MGLTRFSFPIFLIVMTSFAWRDARAEVESLEVWQPHPQGIRYVFPKLRGVTSEDLARKYTQSLRSSSIYGPMQDTDKLRLSAKPETFSALPASSPEHPRVAVVLNRPAQMVRSSKIAEKTVASFEAEGPRLFAIPVGLETTLNPADMKKFRELLNGMDGQLALGGNDPHPLLFGESDTSHSRGDISLKRDLAQIEYLREYLAHGKGRVFYICGSMELAAVMDGRLLHKDIAHLSKAVHQIDDGIGAVVEAVAEEGSEVAAATGQTRFQTMNGHHMAVNPELPPTATHTPSFRITAYNIEPDGSRGPIVKALDFPNHSGFGTQFHPEFGTLETDRRLIRYVATGWKMRARVAPSEILKCMRREIAAHH